MKLFLIHVGFYDNNIMDGLYEQHGNIFVVAKDVKEAKREAIRNHTYKMKKMHIDGIKELNTVGGYRIQLVKKKIENKNNNYSYDDIKKI